MTKPLPPSDPITAQALFPTLEALLKAAKMAGAELLMLWQLMGAVWALLCATMLWKM